MNAASRDLRHPRVRAPEMLGKGGWINTGGKNLTLASLRGKCVIVDFWAFCCINCLHVLDELRAVEEKYSDVLVVVGVHSPKFAHEADHQALLDAVERYEVNHPVLDDPDLNMWRQYAVRAWPTLVVVDPEGYVVAQAAGEGHAEAISRLVDELVLEHDRRGTLRRGDGPYVPPPAASTELRFPGKVAVLPAGTLLVSDSKHHSLLELAAGGESVVRRIGSGERGLLDGPAEQARFAEPQGVCVLPEAVADTVGYDVVVADTVNHVLRGVRLADGAVRTVARAPEGVPLSPWDVAWWQPAGDDTGVVAVAAAGTHQLWAFDPLTGDFAVLAGTTTEGLRDGALEQAWFAQPSGLSAAGPRLWIADSETSALRYVEDGELHTVVGQGLFDFGHRDGPAAEALLQHPLGVAVLPDGAVAVLDTYNDAVRRYDPATGEVSTLATGVREPSDAVVVDGDLVVVESAAHRVHRIALADAGAPERITGPAQQTQRPATEIAPGPLALEVVFEPAPGQKLDERYGPATRLQVSASPPELLVEGAGDGAELSRKLVFAEGTPGNVVAGVLHVTAQAASCDTDAEHPACHLTRQDWGVPLRLVAGAPSRLGLVLRGLDN